VSEKSLRLTTFRPLADFGAIADAIPDKEGFLLRSGEGFLTLHARISADDAPDPDLIVAQMVRAAGRSDLPRECIAEQPTPGYREVTLTIFDETFLSGFLAPEDTVVISDVIRAAIACSENGEGAART